jgi:uncharacterized protein (UPF0332 family)
LTPEAAAHLDKARRSLANARTMLDVNLTDEAGRAAYLAAFHAAQAFIFERTGRTPKSHTGVHGQFGKLAKDEPGIDVALRRFLSQAYDMKTIVDYETRQVIVPLERAHFAIETANRFIACGAGLIA